MERLKSDIDKILEEYFLSFDSNIKNKIFSQVSEEWKGTITQVENTFIYGQSIMQLIATIGFAESADFISTLRKEYYFALIDRASDIEESINSTRKEEYDRITNSGNELFIRIKKEWSEIKDFENELPGIVQYIERKALKQELQKVVEFENFDISDAEIEQALSQVERSALKKMLIDFDESGMERLEFGKTGTYDYSSIDYQTQASSSKKKSNFNQRKYFKYAIAASFFTLLIVGVFFRIYDKHNTSRPGQLSNVPNQIRNNKDSNPKSPHLLESNGQLATISLLEVTNIADKHFGFVQNTPHEKIHLIVYPTTDSSSPKSKYGTYKLKEDSLFIISNDPQASYKIYYFDINAQTEEIVDSSGQFVELERPALNGYYIYAFGSFFSIKEKSGFAPLIEVDAEKKELLKYYTK